MAESRCRGDARSRKRASGWRSATAATIRDLPKGDALVTAQLAGIMAAKRTSELIPLCHPLPLTHVEVRLEVVEAAVEIEAVAETTAQTGVEMEALVAATVAALTVYDMAKAIDKAMAIGDVRLVEKTKEPVVKAAVLTVSDGVHAGVREDASGDVLEELLADEGFEVARRVVAGRARGDLRRASPSSRSRCVARPDNRRHRLRAARRHARGDARRPRPRGARDRRGDPRRRAARTPHALLSRGVAGLRGRDAGRQPARLARRLP